MILFRELYEKYIPDHKSGMLKVIRGQKLTDIDYKLLDFGIKIQLLNIVKRGFLND